MVNSSGRAVSISMSSATAQNIVFYSICMVVCKVIINKNIVYLKKGNFVAVPLHRNTPVIRTERTKLGFSLWCNEILLKVDTFQDLTVLNQLVN